MKKPSWRTTVIAIGVLMLIGAWVYQRMPHYRPLKTDAKTVPHDMVMVEQLPAFEKRVKLKLVAAERDNRPLTIYWLDDRSHLTKEKIDARHAKDQVLCDHGNLAAGAEFELPPGRYLLCFELSEKAVPKNTKAFNLSYSLYEHR